MAQRYLDHYDGTDTPRTVAIVGFAESVTAAVDRDCAHPDPSFPLDEMIWISLHCSSSHVPQSPQGDIYAWLVW